MFIKVKEPDAVMPTYINVNEISLFAAPMERPEITAVLMQNGLKLNLAVTAEVFEEAIIEASEKVLVDITNKVNVVQNGGLIV